MTPRGTVYDRMKKTGYLMGPNHRMGAAMDMESAPPAPAGPAAADGEQDEPPNLQDSGEAGGGGSCGECVNFEYDQGGDQEGSGACKLHGDYPVTPNQVCDDFQSEEEGEQDDGSQEEAAEMPGIAAMQGPRGSAAVARGSSGAALATRRPY
jgi:hypothetical protein